MHLAKRFLSVLFLLSVICLTAAHAETAGEYVGDAAITTKVKAALLSDNQLKAAAVEVKTDAGDVQLNGKVETRAQETEAVRVANEVDGVKIVKDMLIVQNSQGN